MNEVQKGLEIDGVMQEFDSNKTFGAISEEIKKQLGPNRVLTEITIDSRPVDLGEEERLRHIFLKNLGSVSIKTRDVHELFRESLELAPRICEALELDCGDVETFFENKEYQMAQDRVGEMTSLLEWLLQLISGVHSLGTDDIETLEFSGGKVIESVNRMQTLLTRLHIHMASQQWEEFRVVLKGDFLAEVKTWRNLFEDVVKTWNPRTSARES